MEVAELGHLQLCSPHLSSWEEGLGDISSFHHEVEVSGTVFVRAG